MRKKLLIGLGAGALSTGLALIGIGAYWVSLDGQGTCGTPPRGLSCPLAYDTTPQGIAGIVGGAALAVTGAVMLGLGVKERQAPVLMAPMVSNTGAVGVLIGGSF